MEINNFINPLGDFGFKNLFGKENSKENLIDLLNAIFEDDPFFGGIVDVNYINSELKAQNEDMQSSLFDIHCVTSKGHRFIVEMQRHWEPDFFQRMLYYTITSLVLENRPLIEGKEHKYNFTPVIGIALCDFDNVKFNNDKIVTRFSLLNCDNGDNYGNYIGLIFLSLTKVPPSEDSCKTKLERITYLLKNMETIGRTKKVPFSESEGDLYDRLWQMSHVSSLTESERQLYNRYLIRQRDERRRLQFSFEEGENKGKWEIVCNLYKKGIPLEIISETSGFSIDYLRDNLTEDF